MSETDLSRDIQRTLAKLGIWCIRVQSGKVRVRGGWMQLAEEGTPDLCCPALALWLEVKTLAGEPKPSQVAWHARAKREGVKVAVVRSISEAIGAVSRARAEAEIRVFRAGGIDKGEGGQSCQAKSNIVLCARTRWYR